MGDEGAKLRMALPKGHMRTEVFALLEEAGIRVRVGERNYRPSVSLDGVSAKMMKPQNIVGMLRAGSRDIGFTGADWVEELGAELVELLDTGLDPVRLVAAAPEEMVAAHDGLPERTLVVASEYEQLTRRWIERNGVDAEFLKAFGATEVFPPDDADCIVDNTATGATLEANHLEIVDTLLESSTRLYTTEAVLDDPEKRARIEDFVLLLESVLEARERVMIEVNVPEAHLEAVVEVLPCMQEPTISALHHEAGYAVKVAAPKRELPRIIPEIKARGGSDIIVSSLAQIVP